MASVDDVIVASLDRARSLLDGGANAPGLLKMLEEADASLKLRLTTIAQVAGGPTGKFSEAQAQAYQKQTALTIDYVKNRIAKLTHDQSLAACSSAVKQTATDLTALDKAFTGVAIPLRLREAGQMGGVVDKAFKPLLAQQATSVDRYGAAMTDEFRGIMRTGLMVGASNGQVVDALVGHGGPKGPKVSLAARVDPATGKVIRLREEDIPEGLFVRKRYWAQRIVRTEIAHAQNEGRLRAIELEAVDFPDLGKKILAVLDNRTAADSLYVHGQVRKVDELFQDGAGRQYLRPPARPNDRETIVPWRLEWADTPYTEPADSVDVAEAITKGETGESRRLMIQQAIVQHEAAAAQNVPDLQSRVESLVATKVAETIAAQQAASHTASLLAAKAKAAAEVAEAVAKAQEVQALAEAAAVAKAQEMATAIAAGQAAIKLAAKLEAAKQEAAQYVALQEKAAALAVAVKQKQILDGTIEFYKNEFPKTAEGASAALSALRGLASSNPSLFLSMYRHLSLKGAPLSAKAEEYVTQKSHVKAMAASMGKKLGFSDGLIKQATPIVPTAKPAKAAPPPPPPPPPPPTSPQYDLKLQGSNFLDIHDPATGAKLGYVLVDESGYKVTPPPGLGHGMYFAGRQSLPFAIEYALAVSKKIQAKKVAAPPPTPPVAAAQPTARRGRGAEKYPAGFKQWVRPEVTGNPEQELERRWTDRRAGVGVAADGDWIEGHNVSVQQETDEKGNVFLVARFKLSGAASLAARKHMLAIPGSDNAVEGGWSRSTEEAAKFQASKPDEMSVVRSRKTTSRQEDVPHIVSVSTVSTGEREPKNRSAVSLITGKESIADQSLAAMHNSVEVRVKMPKPGEPKWEPIAKAVQSAFGIDVREKPNPKQQQAAKRAALIAKFGAAHDRQALGDRDLQVGGAFERRVNDVWEAVEKRLQSGDPESLRLMRAADKDTGLREVAPGRVGYYSQALADEAVASQRVVFHDITEADDFRYEQLFARAGGSNAASSLLSSRERYQRGIFTSGSSTGADFKTGGADSVFTRLGTNVTERRDRIQIDPAELGRLDRYSYNHDKYGRVLAQTQRRDDREVLQATSEDGDSNETMFQHSISLQSIRLVSLGKFPREKLLQKLKDQGVVDINGIKPESLFREK